MTHGRSAAARFILDNSLLLLAGTVAAVTWANVDHDSYDHLAHRLHFWVNDVGKVFFFALAAKEVFEATLPGGALASESRAASPLAAAVRSEEHTSELQSLAYRVCRLLHGKKYKRKNYMRINKT